MTWTTRAAARGLSELRRRIEPIAPADVADAIAFAVAAPPQVNVAELIVLPTRQG